MDKDTTLAVVAIVMAVILIALTAAYAYGVHVGRKEVLNELMRKPIKQESLPKRANA